MPTLNTIDTRIGDRVLYATLNTPPRRIAGFPPAAIADAKRRINQIALPAMDALHEDSRLFLAGIARPESRDRIALLFERGLQTNSPLEAELGAALEALQV